jgi:threonine synthase
MATSLQYINFLRCANCGQRYSPSHIKYTCWQCGPVGTLEVIYDYQALGQSLEGYVKRVGIDGFSFGYEPSIWRYRPLLPVSDTLPIPALQIGWSPLYKAENLRKALELPNLFVKDDTRNPSASLKDRASAVVMMKARELGAKAVATASTGNAAASLAVMAAVYEMPCYIFVPEKAPRAKIAQLVNYGAQVFLVEGNYDQCFELCLTACEKYGWYNRNTGYNPFTVEGKKTVGLEIAEQLGGAPDKVLVPVGDGCIISGVYKGFYDLWQLGLIEKVPQMIAVQAEGSRAIADALERPDKKIEAVETNTLADSISVSLPRNGAMALKHIQESNGFAVTCSDTEILEGMRLLARRAGVFAEPSAAIVAAALVKLKETGRLDPAERIVALITGNGLKDIDSALKSMDDSDNRPHKVEATLEALDIFLI